MQRGAEIKFSVLGVVGHFDFEVLAEVEVETFNNKYFEHGGQ